MENKTKSSKVWLIAILAIVIILAVIGGYYLKNASNPKNVFISQLNKSIDNYNSKAVEIKNKTNSTISLSTKIESDNAEVKQIADYINDGKITLNLQADTDAKKALMALDVDYKNEKFLSGNMYYQNDNNIYFYVNDLFDKYLKTDLNEMIDKEELEQIKSLLSGDLASFGEKVAMQKTARIIKREIKENFDEKYFSKENADGMTKNTMKIKVGELRQVITTIVKNLENNKEYINTFKKPEEQVKALEEILEVIDRTEEYDDYDIELSLYTTGSFVNEVKKIEICIKASEKEQGTFTIKEVDKNNYEFNLNVKMEENNMPITAEALNGTIKIEDIDKETKNVTVLIENIPNFGKITLYAGININDKTTLEGIDVSNSVDVNNMSQADQMKLYTNLTKMKFYTMFSAMFN